MIAAIAAVVAPVASSGARADAPALGGYQMTATADAISLLLDQPSFGVPAPHTFELHKAHAATSIDSGSSHALSSIVWPGDVYGSAGLALAAGIFLQDPTSARYLDCSPPAHMPCLPVIDNLQKGVAQIVDNAQKGCGCTPSYPFKSQAFFPQGPKDNEYPAPAGVRMTSHADQTFTQATSLLQQAGFPGAFSVGAMKSTATSGIIDGLAVSEADSFVSDIDVAGVLHISGVHTIMKVVSDGTKATVTKSQLIGGLMIGPEAVTIDSSGLHAGGTSQDPLGTVAKALIDQYLAPNGISISVAPPVVTRSPGSGKVTGSGLVITMTAQGMQKLLMNIPQPYRGYLQSPGSSPLSPIFQQFSTFVQGLLATPTQFDQTMQIRLGDVTISSAAAPAFNFPPLPAPPAAPVGPVAGGLLPASQILPGAGSNTTIGGVQQTGPLGITPVAAVAVPIGLILLALLWMFAGATGLDRMATAATSSVAAEDCPLEKP